MSRKTSKLLALYLPYILVGLAATNLGEAWRLSVGGTSGERIMSLMYTVPQAFGNPLPSLHPFDLLIGLLWMDTLSDVMALIAELSDKAGIRFEIDVKRPPHAEEWSCAIRFNGNQADAEHNADLCLFLESFRNERERLETYWSDRAQYDEWLDHQLAYYAPIPLADKERETLTPEERIRRRDMLVAQQVEQAKQKAAGLETDSEN